MYPKLLFLKNFLSYGEKGTEIDFSPYRTLLLTGKNGAGKSGVLDAILWVLWGQTRTGGDNDIMHHGASDMEVRLDFIVRDHPYRVIRKRSKKGRSFVSVLELQSLTEPITLLTDATINKTQESINRLIGLDYELLVNSAFLRQGGAQEFTKKSPSKRKAILASMLGLDQYAELHEQVKEEKKKIDNEITLAQVQKEQIQIELERKDAELAEIEKHAIKDREQEIQILLKQKTKHLQNLEKELHIQKEKTGKMLALQAEQERLVNKVQASSQKKQEIESTLLEIKAKAPQTAVLEVNLEELERKEKHFNELQQTQWKITELGKSEEHVLSRLNQEESHFENRKQEIADQITNLEKKIQQSGIEQKDFLSLFKKAEEQKKLLIQNQADLLKISGDSARIEQVLATITAQGNEIKKKKEDLGKLGHNCPLCKQDIDDKHKHAIKTQYDSDRELLVEEFKKKNQELKTLQTAKQKLEKKLIEIQKTVDQLPLIQELMLATEQIKELAQKTKTLESSFKKEQITIKNELTALQTQKKSIHFSETDLQKAQKDLENLRTLQKQAQNEQDMQIQLVTLQKEIALHDAILRETEKEHSTIKKTLTELQTSVGTDIENDHEQTTAEIQSLEQELANINNIKSLAQHIQKEQKHLAEQKKKHETIVLEMTDKQEPLQILTEAFSYKGIPSMLIEEAIPRLEQYANEIVSFLSENTMTIRLSLTRPSKTDRDAQIETLDILIGDAFGTRAYELFSGGEAFRIDIALRLALTKLLAEQTGGQSEFLVIDEGFGSQDDNGKDNIVQIIHKLENFFRLIILITHVDTLKETFPDRLVIRKGPSGSEILVDHDD